MCFGRTLTYCLEKILLKGKRFIKPVHENRAKRGGCSPVEKIDRPFEERIVIKQILFVHCVPIGRDNGVKLLALFPLQFKEAFRERDFPCQRDIHECHNVVDRTR